MYRRPCTLISVHTYTSAWYTGRLRFRPSLLVPCFLHVPLLLLPPLSAPDFADHHSELPLSTSAVRYQSTLLGVPHVPFLLKTIAAQAMAGILTTLLGRHRRDTVGRSFGTPVGCAAELSDVSEMTQPFSLRLRTQGLVHWAAATHPGSVPFVSRFRPWTRGRH